MKLCRLDEPQVPASMDTAEQVYPACPLCYRASGVTGVRGADARSYFRCPECMLIYADAAFYLPPAEERAHYLTHENGPDQPGHVRFLQQLVAPLLPLLRPGMRGLDYGSGPVPTLSHLLRQHGVDCDDYDPFFTQKPLQPPYDFVVSTEVFEHFFRPEREIARIREVLAPGGLLAIMTERWATIERFSSWYYTKDPTHVAYYHSMTFDYICEKFGFQRLSELQRVVILRRDSI